MTTRITQRMMTQHSLSSLQLGLNRLSDSQEKLSTGRNINRPSDSPTGTNDAMRLRAQLAADTQHARNAQDGLSFLGTTDSTMQSMLDNVRRARDLLVQGASTGNSGPDARAALATELTQIREALIGEANTQYLGRPIFGGTTASEVAYGPDPTAVPPVSFGYLGDAHPVERTIGDGIKVKVNLNGPDAFSTAGGDDLFTVLKDAIDDLTNNPSDTSTNLGRLDAVANQMKSALADVGTRYGRIETAQTVLTGTTLDNQAALSEIENVDVAKAIVDVQMQEVAYQAALGATARVIQPSLLDFLR